jgi:L-threonylcarbamoyladenylate synthase
MSIPEAIAKIYQAKGRPSDNPLILHGRTIEQAIPLFRNFTPLMEAIFTYFAPGPITLIAHKHHTVPDSVTAGLETVAVRIPKHPTAQQLLERCKGIPLAAPSANRSGYPSPTSAVHVLQDLQGRIPFILDGDDCPVGIESTVVDMTEEERPIIVRPGTITKESLERVTGTEFQEMVAATVAKPISPGMKYRHYAPNATVSIVHSMKDLINEIKETSKSLILISDTAKNMVLQGIGQENEMSEVVEVQLLTEKTLYSKFRYADEYQIPTVIVFCDEEVQAKKGLMNRIEKAASRV